MQSGILSLTDIIGIAAFAFAGILAADGKKLDPVGVFVMAFTTAFGGGRGAGSCERYRWGWASRLTNARAAGELTARPGADGRLSGSHAPVGASGTNRRRAVVPSPGALSSVSGQPKRRPSR